MMLRDGGRCFAPFRATLLVVECLFFCLVAACVPAHKVLEDALGRGGV
jgi:hypothetical protein